MAFIGVKVPADAAASLARIKVPGEPVPPEEMHVTLLYLGKNVPIPDVLQATMACYMMTKRWTPFRATSRRVTCFSQSEEGEVPVVARVLCPELHRLHMALRKSLDFMEIEYSKKYPEYKPHITLSYSKKPMPDVKIPSVAWEIGELVIWGGDDGTERIAVTLPLEGGPGVENPLREALRV